MAGLEFKRPRSGVSSSQKKLVKPVRKKTDIAALLQWAICSKSFVWKMSWEHFEEQILTKNWLKWGSFTLFIEYII